MTGRYLSMSYALIETVRAQLDICERADAYEHMPHDLTILGDLLTAANIAGVILPQADRDRVKQVYNYRTLSTWCDGPGVDMSGKCKKTCVFVTLREMAYQEQQATQ